MEGKVQTKKTLPKLVKTNQQNEGGYIQKIPTHITIFTLAPKNVLLVMLSC